MILLAAFTWFAVLAAEKPPLIKLPINLTNGCMVTALEYESALQAREHLKNITVANLVATATHGYLRNDGHAYCVFKLRNGDIWSYDSVCGSNRLKIHPFTRAQLFFALRNGDIWSYDSITYSRWQLFFAMTRVDPHLYWITIVD